jgi:hypothetical protein
MNKLLILVIFAILSLPKTYNLSSKICKKSPLLLVILHTSIFIISLYLIKKVRENFNLCDPGYKMNDAHNTYHNPFKSWCVYGKKEKEDELNADDGDEDEILKLLNQQEKNNCGSKKTDDNEELYEDRDSWCTMKDKL